MLKYEDLPEDNADLAKISIDFPFLTVDSSGSCPITNDEILDYLSKESPDGDAIKSKSLRFLRTAKVEDRDYWIWSFVELDGTLSYVTVSRQGTNLNIGYSPDFYGLTPEQFILGDYYDVF